MAIARRDRNVLLTTIWSLGALVRLFPLLLFADVFQRPLGMGGLYLLFSRRILEGGFALPRHIPYYSQQGLPYAYPPLAFYIEALALRLLPGARFVVVNGLPVLFSIASIGAFYLLARAYLEGERRALLATAIYSLMPAAFMEHLPGEGLVEGLGTVLFILGVLWFLHLNRVAAGHAEGAYSSATPGVVWRHTLLLGFFVGLNIAASPGGAYGMAVTVGLLWLLQPRGRRAPLWRLGVALVVGLLVSAPYWLTVILRHGPAIFARTFLRQHGNLGVWLMAKLGFVVEQQTPLSPWGVLAMVGLAVCLARRRFALALWCVAVYMIPREFSYLMAVPTALLACRGLLYILSAAVARRTEGRIPAIPRLRPIAVSLLLVLFGWAFIRSIGWAMVLPQEGNLVTRSELNAMAWIQANTPAESTFLAIGDEVEWFPILTERTTLNVIWGSEWVEDDTVFHLAEALAACQSAACYLQSAAAHGLPPDYLYISRTPEQRCIIAMAAGNDRLELVWENEGAALFRVRGGGG